MTTKYGKTVTARHNCWRTDINMQPYKVTQNYARNEFNPQLRFGKCFHQSAVYSY